MAESKQHAAGLRVRKEVLGAEYVEAALSKTTAFDKDFQDIVTEYCWGGTWGKGVLTKQQRSLLNLGMIAALGRMHEWELHFRAALVKNKVPLEELREILIQIAVYCGIPAGVECFRIAKRVLQEEGIDASQLKPRPEA
ncbi:carboxymuconolactone decarboxylase family protein [Desertibaculum subflavum]|uniref:carboxymuconolactone decarboxylase family protein n=1 Tax=Desertibaculum subflavum TaxID=2268458 RepID=UPI000E662657